MTKINVDGKLDVLSAVNVYSVLGSGMSRNERMSSDPAAVPRPMEYLYHKHTHTIKVITQLPCFLVS